MKKDYTNRAGSWRINLSGQAAYRSFIPTNLPLKPPIEMDAEMIGILVHAASKVAVLNNMSKHIPDMDLFVSMYVRKEALMSSQIEGTQATLEDIFDPGIDVNKNRDVGDVVNYIKAYDFAIERLDKLPICSRLIKETHAILLEGVRGDERTPGEFRRSQNWIGGPGSTINTARYIPPAVEDMEKAFENLEKYMNSVDNTHDLIRAALIHYQFETIHPFLDGNGRIGRLLIILYLIERKVLDSPALYISYFLKRNRSEYYERMNLVRETGNYEQWIKFFLIAVLDSATDATNSIDELVTLKDYAREIASSAGGRSANLKVLAYLEKNPITEIGSASKELGLSFNTVSSAIKRLSAAGIIAEKKGKSRQRVFYYKPYLEILGRGTNPTF